VLGLSLLSRQARMISVRSVGVLRSSVLVKRSVSDFSLIGPAHVGEVVRLPWTMPGPRNAMIRRGPPTVTCDMAPLDQQDALSARPTLGSSLVSACTSP